MNLNNIIKRPIITEKAVAIREAGNQYAFEVDRNASKGSIKEAAETMFDIDVIDVRTVIVPGKKKRILKTRRFTKLPKWKKAIITIASGQEIKLITEGK